MGDKGISLDKENLKKGFTKTKEFFLNKKVQNILVVLLLIGIIFLGTHIRVQNVPLLKDQTTGEYIPLALDPFYFLRVAETIAENGGSLPEFDSMRYPGLKVGFTDEILPKAIVFLYRFTGIFSENISLEFIDIISPVIFFIVSILIFYFLSYSISKSKTSSIISSLFLSIIPTYLYRTMAGFSDHEAIGIMGFFAAFLAFSISLNFLGKKQEDKNYLKTILFGIITGIFFGFTMVSWGGIATIIPLIFSSSFLIFWLLKNQKNKTKNLQKYLVYYSVFLFSSFLFGTIFGFPLSNLLSRFALSSSGLLSLFVLAFIFVDYAIIKNKKKIKFLNEKFREVYSLGAVVIIGILFLFVVGKNPFQILGSLWGTLISPFGTGRVGLTISENAQPYLTDWISQTGKILFWIFLLGIVLLGFDLSKSLKIKKERYFFLGSYLFLISGILFSRVSQESILNGVNFISQAFYFFGLLIFGVYTLKLYFKGKFSLKTNTIILASWAFFMLITSRSAVRFLFALTPFVAFMVGYCFTKIWRLFRKEKEELSKIILGLVFILIILGLIFSASNSINSSYTQAKYTGPTAGYQWQKAMSWVRENTPQESVFVHWWDYGYWVQTLGERTTITDGGHANGFWDHLIARYLLTTPKPETALSFLKSHDVSYLLIDPTDIGKYPAYSRIGGDGDNDRFASMPVLQMDTSQTVNTGTETIRIYPGGYGVDEDIIYSQGEEEIFFPGPIYDEIGNPKYQSAIAAIILKTGKSKSDIKQPLAIFAYGSKQAEIPLRYVYYNGKLIDFGMGLEGTFFVLPKVTSSNSGASIEEFGSGIYLSPKVSDSLVSQLYLMDDPTNQYENINLVHTESSQIVSILKTQEVDLGEFIYYNGLQGPIKIWEVEENEKIILREEFLRPEGEYAEFDNLQFSR